MGRVYGLGMVDMATDTPVASRDGAWGWLPGEPDPEAAGEAWVARAAEAWSGPAGSDRSTPVGSWPRLLEGEDLPRARELYERAAELGGDAFSRDRLATRFGLSWYARG